MNGVAKFSNSSQAVNTPVNSGVAGSSSALNTQKDATESSTAPKFGDVYKQIQAKYGAKTEKPREIKKTLGKDDFLRIMVTQMKFQDPTNPFKPEQMAAEMAQFASVEQLQNVNQNLQKMTTQNNPLERLAMTNMIGKVVTIDRERFPHTENSPDNLSFVLPKDAKEVKVAVVAESGETVFEKSLGELKAGENSFNWDGIRTNTLPAKTGTYMLRVEAKDEKGTSLKTNPQGQARVVGVSFEGTEPVFLIGDAKKQDKVTLRNIVRIEDSGAMAAGTPVPAQANGASAELESKPNLIAFQKGVGSSNLDPNQLSPEMAGALAKYQQAHASEAAAQQGAKVAQAAAEAAGTSKPAQGEEKGFPNGLQDE